MTGVLAWIKRLVAKVQLDAHMQALAHRSIWEGIGHDRQITSKYVRKTIAGFYQITCVYYENQCTVTSDPLTKEDPHEYAKLVQEKH